MSLGLQGYLTLSVNVSKFNYLLSGLGLSAWSGSAVRFYYFVFLFFILSPLLCGTLLTGCAAPLLALGSSGTAAVSSLGTSAASVAVANPMTATSLASSAATGKSPLEHIASAATKKECNFLNALGPKPICEEIPVPGMIDHSEPYLGPADITSTPLKP